MTRPTSVGAPSTRRLVASIALAVLGATAAVILLRYAEWRLIQYRSDLDVQLAGARYLLQGRNPYPLIGPGREFQWPGMLYHPAPTLMLLAPLAWLSEPLARELFVGITAFVFAFSLAITRGPWWRFLMCISASAAMVAVQAQWTYLLATMWLVPAAAVLAVIKPNIGAALVAARAESRWMQAAVIGGLGLLAASLLVFPGWPRWWLVSLASDPNRGIAMFRPWGFVLALAALKWRRPEARLLLVLSLVPQTLGTYDALLLFFIPARLSEMGALVALSYFCEMRALALPQEVHTINELVVRSSYETVWWLFLPALAMVLARPNVGEVPTWVTAIGRRLRRRLREVAA